MIWNCSGLSPSSSEPFPFLVLGDVLVGDVTGAARLFTSVILCILQVGLEKFSAHS